MFGQSEYEKLKAKGYTEEEIRVALDSLSKISLAAGALGENRDDRTVMVKDAEGIVKKTSSIMMGYNKQNIQLENGEYVSYEDFKDALEETMADDKDNVVYVCKRTGKKVESTEICEEVFKQVTSEMSSLSLSESDKLPNQTSAKIEINDPSLDKTFSKGLLMLGNVGLKLPNGEYISATEVEKALEDYVKLEPKKNAGPVEPKTPVIPVIPIDPKIPIIDHYEEEEKEVEPHEVDPIVEDELEELLYKVILRYKKAVPPEIIALITAILMFLSMLKITDKEVIEKIEQTSVVAPYSITELVESNLDNTNIDNIQLSTGQEVELDAGTHYYGSSDYEYGGNNTRGIIGSSIRSEGKYTAEYFSFIHNGKIIGTQMNQNQDLYDSLEKIANDNNISVDDIEVKVHFGGPTCGWVSLNDIRNNVPTKDVDMEVEGATYEGIVDNFNGNSISLKTANGLVSINVCDQNGMLLQPGSVVIGSDGIKYKIGSLEVEKVTTTKEVVSAEKRLSFSLKNISLNDVIVTALAASLAAMLLRKDKKVMTEMTNEQILELIENARKEYANDSEFEAAVRTIIGDKDLGDKSSIEALREALIAQETTVQDIRNIGGATK